jgi:hypothetical protein
MNIIYMHNLHYNNFTFVNFFALDIPELYEVQ